jgi:membrane fusion protein (multidrug efflux system)
MNHRQSIVLVALLLAAAGTTACGSPADSSAFKGPPPVSVEVVSVERRPIRDLVQFVGQLEAEESVPLRSEIDGIVDTVEFQEGDHVEKGALLFRLRDDEQRARLREAEAALVLARQEYDRAKELIDRRTVSQSEFDDASARFQVATARRDVMNVQLEQTEIRAPFDGVLGARLVSPGERVSEETDLVRIDAVDRLRLLFSVPEIALTAVAAELPLELAVAPWPEKKFSGRVYFVAPTVDPATRRVLVKAWVPNPDHALRPGMFATVTLELARKEAALVIPESALAYDAVGPYVWRIDANDAAERVGVRLGIRRDAIVEIVSGLSAGDRVVSAGVHKVSPGSRIQIAALNPAKAPAEVQP